MRLHTSFASTTRPLTWVAWFGMLLFTASCGDEGQSSKIDIPDIIEPDIRPTAELDQCANGPLGAPVSCGQSKNWVAGDLDATRAHYVEGEIVPYRIRFGSLEPGRTEHTVRIEWQTVVSQRTDHHALDYLATFDRTEPAANPCAGVAGCSRTAVSSFPIFLDPAVSAGPDGLTGTSDDIAPLPAQFRLYGGSIVAVSAYSVRYLGRSSATSVLVTFTTTVPNPVLAWGGHIALRSDWLPEPTAVFLPGSPYRMRVLSLDARDAFQERTLCSTGVHGLPQVVVEKQVVNDNGGTASAQDFTMRVVGSEASPAAFPGADWPGTVVTLQPGPFTVTEDSHPGYAATFEGDCFGKIDYDQTLFCLVTNSDLNGCEGRVCPAPASDCLEAGVCNPQTGSCEYLPKAVGSACEDDGNLCTRDLCDALGACTHPPGHPGRTCRESVGVCDVAEVCSGVAGWCPPDGFAAPEVVCRAAAGVCDVPERCTGSAAECPVDSKSRDACRVSAGMCDMTEVCDGESSDCPPDAFVPAGIECRAAAGPCDLAEACTGAAADCPADLKSRTECRAAAGPCDVPEACDGSTDACPPDRLMPETTVCRASAGVCDVPETCTGADAACPDDARRRFGDECRPAAGVCDFAESCDGRSALCPADGFRRTSTECRAATGPCDVAEWCTGSGPSCPDDALAPAGTVCRAATDACDPAEVCAGDTATCPADIAATCTLCGAKFYDADVDGVLGEVDPAIPGWHVELTRAGVTSHAVTDSDGAYLFTGLSEGDYLVCEVMPEETNWLALSPLGAECRTVHVPMDAAEACLVDFGNVCLGAGGARSPGFWTSCNGETAFLRHDHGTSALCMLRALDLWDAYGHAFNPFSYCQFKEWVLHRTAVNMAYQLSAQLAAMELNVLVGYVDTHALVYAPGLASASPFGFATIGDVLAEVKAELGRHGHTPAGSPYRAYQEALERVLDAANNNLDFLQSAPCGFSYPSPDEGGCASN